MKKKKACRRECVKSKHRFCKWEKEALPGEERYASKKEKEKVSQPNMKL